MEQSAIDGNAIEPKPSTVEVEPVSSEKSVEKKGEHVKSEEVLSNTNESSFKSEESSVKSKERSVKSEETSVKSKETSIYQK